MQWVRFSGISLIVRYFFIGQFQFLRNRLLYSLVIYIFFGFNKCSISQAADSVLSEAASAAKTQGSAQIQIVGHTDTVGSARYNQKLSECRANAAAKNLVGKGIPKGAIHSSGVGESDLLVQTGDGVKEPQNRRAAIDLE